MVEVRILEEAENDFAKALVWYADRSMAAAIRFDELFVETLERIGEDPGRFPRCDEEGFQYVVMRGFPYKIIYRINNVTVEIVAFVHTSRRAGSWTGRI